MVGRSLVQNQVTLVLQNRVALVLQHQEGVLANLLCPSPQCPVARLSDLSPQSLLVLLLLLSLQWFLVLRRLLLPQAPQVEEDRHQARNPVRRPATRQCRRPRKVSFRQDRAVSSRCRRVRREAAGRVLACCSVWFSLVYCSDEVGCSSTGLSI